MTGDIKPMEIDCNTNADRGAALVQALEAFDDDFANLLLADQKAPLPSQDATLACASTTPRSSPDCAPQAPP